MSKFRFCCLILLSLVPLASADLSNSLSPQPAIGNFGIYSQCPPAGCWYSFWIGTSASGWADFPPLTPIGTPISFNFETDQPLSWYWNGNYVYYATFGYGGFFDMTGPDGSTFTGVVTSGFAAVDGLSSQVDVNFFGQWTTGQYADGGAVLWQHGGGTTTASLYEEIAPEPSSLVLLGTGLLGLLGWGRKLMH